MALEHTHGTLMLNLDYATTVSLTTLGASVVGLPMYVVRKVLHNPAPSPILPLKSLSVIPLLAGSFLLLKPKLAHSMSSLTSPRQPYLMAYFSVVFFAIITGTLLFLQPPGPMDFLVAAVLGYGLYPEGSRVAQAVPQTPTARIIRAYLKTILANSESRKIFYFLMLNMCYMLVQMLYGVWTNSLGLISDAIHMAFDCMAIAVGLMASVMATWPPNERFTYGYGRIETLSGFANGIFLILISIFIVFEAIERLLEPPEMNTSQLLLVSSLGLGVNLFGMFAMGGHHHGHSHSHGHSHGSHAHSHAHDEGHDHAHDHKPESPVISSSLHDGRLNLQGAREHDHSDSHSQEHSHWHSHSQPHSQEHSHSHSQVGDEHVHAHSPPGSTERNTPRSLHAAAHHKRRSFPGPALLIDGGSEGKPLSATHLSPAVAKSLSSATVVSPITPSYHFGHDEHYDTHHHDEHVPNLHDHSHVHDRHEGHSHNMRGVFLHVMADTLGSVGVIISTLLIQYYGWTGFDPIASLFIAVMIAASVIPLVIDTGKILCLDVGDRESDIQHALEELSSVHGLQSYSSVRFWPKDASSLIGSIHVQLSPSASNHDPTGPHSSTTTSYASVDRVVEKVDMLLRKRISGLEELSIQVEGHQRVSR
ncbi:cation efflux protein [Punctularia strigosozonata HHB-11173 SS5]|uniref:cation efflux protein n=1 Tax=Punctularia strigosozonata (strain HHB-11173) TaxID=741275 RepID=UPI00044184BB|nr:cation efflux protein [Punctularia strigosozonata HHB-11173 SS5]EIN06026.1 cation efflux protein [Punctularia strigosozonata HHB-11173 SS5]